MVHNLEINEIINNFDSRAQMDHGQRMRGQIMEMREAVALVVERAAQVAPVTWELVQMRGVVGLAMD